MDPDPFVMYIVVRTGLHLSAGKVGAQCGHAVDYLYREVVRLRQRVHPVVPTELEALRLSDFGFWQAGEHGKIVLAASDAEFERVKTEEPDHFLVVDLGHTEVAPKTETALQF
jgi:peptidyl-tRNA hydrolase